MNRNRTKECLMIVDDDADLLFVLQSQLKREGFHVLTNMSGENLLQELALQKPGIVLLDLSMNMINGSELCKQIKRLYPTGKPKVLIMSGNHDIEKVASQCGADGFVAKPLSLEELLAAITKYS